MKLNIEGCKAFARDKNITSYYDFSRALELDVDAIFELEKGNQIGYEAVKDIYNKFGEKVVKKIINFEGEIIDEFKSKFTLCGGKLC